MLFRSNKLIYDSKTAPDYQQSIQDEDLVTAVPPAKLSPSLSNGSKTEVNHEQAYITKSITPSSKVLEKNNRRSESTKVSDYKSDAVTPNDTKKKPKKKFFSNLKGVIAA